MGLARAYASWWGPSATTPSTSACAISASARARAGWPSTTRGACEPAALSGGRLDAGDGRPTGGLPAGRQRPLRGLRPVRRRRSPPPTSRGRGCTWTGRWGCGRPPRRDGVTSWRAAAADSWATDAHKTLNVPYDCGLAIVRDRAALRAAMGMHGEYLVHAVDGEPLDKVPEISRRGRAFTVWAVLRTLGRAGVADLVDGFCDRAAVRGGIADPRARGAQRRRLHPGLPDLRRRRADPGRRGPLLEDGTTWMSGSRWRARGRHRADLGEQLEHHRRRRTTLAGRPAAGRGSRTLGNQSDAPDRVTGPMAGCPSSPPAKAAPGDRVAVLSPSSQHRVPEVHEQALAADREVTGLGAGRVPDHPTARRLARGPGGRPQRRVRRPGHPGRARHDRGRGPDHCRSLTSTAAVAPTRSRSSATATTPTS